MFLNSFGNIPKIVNYQFIKKIVLIYEENKLIFSHTEASIQCLIPDVHETNKLSYKDASNKDTCALNSRYNVSGWMDN